VVAVWGGGEIPTARVPAGLAAGGVIRIADEPCVHERRQLLQAHREVIHQIYAGPDAGRMNTREGKGKIVVTKKL